MVTDSDKNNLIKTMGKLHPEEVRAFVGLDGFVDVVMHVVETRHSAESYERLSNMIDFGQKIVESAGLSRNFEFVPMQRKLGGNGPNMAASLLSCGCLLTYVGALGAPNIDPVFANIQEKAQRISSIADPGFTEAIEFHDGKLICSQLKPLDNVTPQSLEQSIGAEQLSKWIAEANLIGFENWTLVNHMTEVWEYFLSDVMPLVPKSEERILFIDLCDPEKRNSEDILRALRTVGKFSKHLPVILGLNEKETREMAQVLGRTENESFEEELVNLGRYVKDKLAIDTLVVHPTTGAYAFTEDTDVYVEGPFCKTPKLTTGAGDNFNAGFCLGKALKLSNSESLLLGVANSGFYVRNARSASFDELMDFVARWDQGELDKEA